MDCVQPPLQKKPARGFAWACAPCSRAQERKLEARNTPLLGETQPEAEPEMMEEEEEDPAAAAKATRKSSPAEADHTVGPATSEQIAQSKLWPFRYLGIHCHVEDALDYDDRIYPRASSRLGARHQANVVPWYGHPVEYAKVTGTKRKYLKSGSKKDLKISKEAIAAIEAERAERAARPKWVMDEPVGYVPRGEDGPVEVNGKQIHTAELLFKMPDASQLPSRGEDDAPSASMSGADREKHVEDYMNRAKDIATARGIERYSTNFLDKALKLLYEENFSIDDALSRLKQVNKYSDLKEPHLRPEEVKLFESGVAKYGSELRLITKHVKTVPHRDIVRYYYMWKKTPQGRKIWGNYGGRKGKKAAKKIDNPSKLVDDVADDHDDSSFDVGKATEKKRGFACKFCSIKSSRQWRRAPATAPGATIPAENSSKKDKGPPLTVALCQRCAVLWRKYGVQWEDPDEVAKKVALGGNKSSRRRFEEELLTQLLTSSEAEVSINGSTATTATSIGIRVIQDTSAPPAPEPPKKKPKHSDKEKDKSNSAATSHPPPEPAPKKKAAEKPVEPPPLIPEPPKPKVLPCAICGKMEPKGDQHLSCRDCRLTIHRQCYGVNPDRSSVKWFCDMCSNDRSPVVSTSYECVLCPVTATEHELMEPPKVSHKKKTDREREKERLEKEMVQEAIRLYRERQEAAGKPIGPREPLKRTAGNNWIHVPCAVWTPEIKFGNAKELEPAEGLGLIPAERFQDLCKICKTRRGACVPCHNSSCNARFHVGCAHEAGFVFGFDITPIKSSRRDTVTTMKLGGETGAVTPAIWCPHHTVSTVVHEMNEPTDVEGLNALQLYAQTAKQADLTLTGTVRKAAHVQQSVGAASSTQNGVTATNRRSSLTNGTHSHHQKDNSLGSGKGVSIEASPSSAAGASDNGGGVSPSSNDKICCSCQSTYSPKWWPVKSTNEFPGVGRKRGLSNGFDMGESIFSNDIIDINGKGRALRNGEINVASADQERARAGLQKALLYECHKCHSKPKSESPAASDNRPSSYPPQRDQSVPIAPAPSAEYSHHHHPLAAAPAHGHPAPQRPMPSNLPVHTPGPQEWRPEYEHRPTEFGGPLIRNGKPPVGPPPGGIPLGPPTFGGGPPPPPPAPPAMNGFHPTVAPHFANGIPHSPPTPLAPHSYPAHQSPYAPMTLPGPINHGPPPHHPPSTGRAYSTAGSPPAPPFTSPHALQALPAHQPRMYSAERTIAPSLHSPQLSRRSIDPQVPSTPGTDENIVGSAIRPGSSGRHNSMSGGPGATGSGSGASASPSLKNLLL